MPNDVAMGNLKGPRGNGVENPRIVGDNLVVDEVIQGVPGEKVVGNVRGHDGSNVLPTKEAIAANIGDMQNGTVIRNVAATRNVLGRVWTRGNS